MSWKFQKTSLFYQLLIYKKKCSPILQYIRLEKIGSVKLLILFNSDARISLEFYNCEVKSSFYVLQLLSSLTWLFFLKSRAELLCPIFIFYMESENWTYKVSNSSEINPLNCYSVCFLHSHLPCLSVPELRYESSEL